MWMRRRRNASTRGIGVGKVIPTPSALTVLTNGNNKGWLGEPGEPLFAGRSGFDIFFGLFETRGTMLASVVGQNVRIEVLLLQMYRLMEEREGARMAWLLMI
jgi:hypothetical protein